MRRSSLATALTVGLMAATAPVVVASTASAGVAAAADDNATVCAATEESVKKGLELFVADMREVSKAVTSKARKPPFGMPAPP